MKKSLLKAKINVNKSDNLTEATKQLRKDDRTKGLYAILPYSYHKKLRRFLEQNDLQYVNWLKQKIEDEM